MIKRRCMVCEHSRLFEYDRSVFDPPGDGPVVFRTCKYNPDHSYQLTPGNYSRVNLCRNFVASMDKVLVEIANGADGSDLVE